MYISESNIEKLKAIYVSKSAAKPVLDYFTTCQADENVVTVDDVQIFFQKKQYVVARQDVINLFKELEELGIGEFIIGRRTQKTRFVSKISLSSVGRSVVDANETEEAHPTNREAEEPHLQYKAITEVAQETKSNKDSGDIELTTVNTEGIEKFLTYSFPLRPNLVISLNLPVDLTDTEAERLSGFIKTLPFNR